MKSDLGKLAILLSILLLVVFPFAGLAPLMLLLFIGILGWMYRLVTTIVAATEVPEAE